MITRSQLEDLYIKDGLSMQEIATKLECSVNRIVYWMNKYGLERRTISDAVYLKSNPGGDPFNFKKLESSQEALLFGLGMGLYWGEGTKTSKNSVRLGNTDAELIKAFISFLVEIFGVDKGKLRFGLQIFSDIDPGVALSFWTKELGVSTSQFTKIIVTISGSIGTYRKKSVYGVVTVQFHNTKLRNTLVDILTTRKFEEYLPASIAQ